MKTQNDSTFIINGREYTSATFNSCPICNADDDGGRPIRYLFVRLVTANGDHLLECPNCDYSITVAKGMVNKNANYNGAIRSNVRTNE